MTGMDGDVDLDLDLDPDPDWARELFDRARGGAEPAWTADSAVLARAGDRRRRLRTAGAGGGLLGVVALTVAVAVGLGAGATDLGSQPGPGGAWGNRPLSDVFKYAAYFSSADNSGGEYIPQSAVSDLATVLGRLDPDLTHLSGERNARPPRIVAARDGHAQQLTTLALTSIWSDDAPRQSGDLTFGFASSKAWARNPGVVTEIGAGNLAAPCDIPLGSAAALAGSTPPAPPPWSPCAVSQLPGGSTLASASARIGTGTVIVVVREFADGEVFSVVAQDFMTPMWQGASPDPATVVKPTPWSEQSLVAALADPAIRSGWSPAPPPDAAAELLQASDLGPGWTFGGGQVDSAVQNQVAMIDLCADDQHQKLAEPAVNVHFSGPLPDGVLGTASETEYQLTAGAGPKAMAAARTAAGGGCANGPSTASQATLIPLPAGIGDDAFAVELPALGEVGLDVRVGDTVLHAQLGHGDQLGAPATTGDQPLDLSSPAGRKWLASLARAMVSRHAAGPGRH